MKLVTHAARWSETPLNCSVVSSIRLAAPRPSRCQVRYIPTGLRVVLARAGRARAVQSCPGLEVLSSFEMTALDTCITARMASHDYCEFTFKLNCASLTVHALPVTVHWQGRPLAPWPRV